MQLKYRILDEEAEMNKVLAYVLLAALAALRAFACTRKEKLGLCLSGVLQNRENGALAQVRKSNYQGYLLA